MTGPHVPSAAPDGGLVCAFTVPGSPVPKARARVVKGHTYTPRQTVEAEERIGHFLKVRYPHLQPSTARLRVELVFRLKGVRGDSDNFCKLVMDALNGKAWVDDKQVDQLSITVQRQSDTPETRIAVWAL